MSKEPSPSRPRTHLPARKGRGAQTGPRSEKGIEDRPGTPSRRLALAWAMYDADREEEGLEAFEHLFREELARPVFTGFAYDELVRIYRHRGDWEKLLSVCRRAVEAQPQDPGLLRTLGEACLAAERASEATVAFEKLTGLDPLEPEHWCALGKARLFSGDPVGAEESYGRAATVAPEDAPLFLSRQADALRRAGLMGRARVAWERYLTLKPDDPPGLMGLGEVLIQEGNPEGAVAVYGRVAVLSPLSAGRCWYRLGKLLDDAGFLSQATEAFSRALFAEPGHSPRYPLDPAVSPTVDARCKERCRASEKENS